MKTQTINFNDFMKKNYTIEEDNLDEMLFMLLGLAVAYNLPVVLKLGAMPLKSLIGGV